MTAPRVLLAEDDPDLRAVLAEVLREQGNEVIEAADGVQLLDRLSETRAADRHFDSYDLVVTDLRMPGYDAFDIMVGMRRSMAETPFIVITAFADTGTRVRAEQLGAIAVLPKPLDIEVLRSAVSDALGQRRA